MDKLDFSDTAVGKAIAMMTPEECERLKNELRRRMQPYVGKKINDQILRALADVIQDEVAMIVAEWE